MLSNEETEGWKERVRRTAIDVIIAAPIIAGRPMRKSIPNTVHCKLDEVGHRSPVLPGNGTGVTP
jgi:hypothetical protein